MNKYKSFNSILILFVGFCTMTIACSCIDKRYQMEPEPNLIDTSYELSSDYKVPTRTEKELELMKKYNIKEPSPYVSIDTIRYGDDRFHECEELVNIVEGVLPNGKRVRLDTIQRDCTEWQKKNYDINDPRAKKHLLNQRPEK